MKKILYLSYDGMTDPLGQSQVLPYLKKLSSDFEIHVISCEKSELYSKYKVDIEKTTYNSNISWHPLIYNKFPPILSTVWDLLKILFLAFRLNKKYIFDIVHCRSHLTALLGMLFKKSTGTPFIFDMRSFFPDERVDGNLWPQSKIIYRLVYKFFKKKEIDMLQYADQNVVLTNAAKQILFSNYGINNIAVIPCCADFDHFNFTKISDEEMQEARVDLNIKSNQFVLTYLGSIGTWYKLPEMLMFFKELKKVKQNAVFIFFTGSSDELIYEEAKILNIDPSDIRIKFVTRENLPKYLMISTASIFFIQNTYSKLASSPTKHAELMGLGIPVIANQGIGDTDQIILESNSGTLINLNKVSPFKDCILSIDQLIKIDRNLIRNSGKEIFELKRGVDIYKSIYLKMTS